MVDLSTTPTWIVSFFSGDIRLCYKNADGDFVHVLNTSFVFSPRDWRIYQIKPIVNAAQAVA